MGVQYFLTYLPRWYLWTTSACPITVPETAGTAVQTKLDHCLPFQILQYHSIESRCAVSCLCWNYHHSFHVSVGVEFFVFKFLCGCGDNLDTNNNGVCLQPLPACVILVILEPRL